MKPYPRSVFKMSVDARLLERGSPFVVYGVRRYFFSRVGVRLHSIFTFL